MLQNDFFTVVSLNGETPSFSALLTVNAQHRIFEGHFPGQPVVPGVCLMQIVQEVAAMALGVAALRLVRADQIKFISLIDPRTVRKLEIKLDCMAASNGTINVTASLTNDGKMCFKFNGVFERE
jgi:3-hydroxyacyl-[acyl-carrier-protein] dehydratase